MDARRFQGSPSIWDSTSKTILFLQVNNKNCQEKLERVYHNFLSVKDALEAIVRIFEEHLEKKMKEDMWAPRSINGYKVEPLKRENIQYAFLDLLRFVDLLGDIFIMENTKLPYSEETCYIPRNKKWIKDELYTLLSNSINPKENQ